MQQNNEWVAMSRSREASLNYVVITISQIILLLLGLVSRAIFIKHLGLEYLGLNSVFSSVLSILSLSNLGLGNALVYIEMQAIAHRKNDELCALFHYSKKVYRVIFIFLLFLSVLFVPFLHLIIKEEVENGLLLLTYFVSVLNMAISYLSGPYSTVYEADQKNRVIKVADTIGYVVSTILQIISLIVWESYVLYCALILISNIISISYIRHRFSKDYRFLSEGNHILKKEIKRNIFYRVKDVFITKISSAAIDSMDNILLSRYLGLGIVGIYNNYMLVFSNVRSNSKNMYSSMESGIGNLYATSDSKTRYSFFKRELLGFQIIAAIFAVTTLTLIQDFISLWIGTDARFPFYIVILLSFDMYVNILGYSQSGCFNTTGLYRYIKWIFMVGAIINVVLSILLGSHLGLSGVILGTILSRVVCTFPLVIYVIYKKLFHEKVCKGFILNTIYILQTVIIAAICYPIVNNIYCDNFLVWFSKAVLTFLLSSALIILFNIKNPELCYFKNLLKTVILKMKR